jgi:Thiolase, C-terminal domain
MTRMPSSTSGAEIVASIPLRTAIGTFGGQLKDTPAAVVSVKLLHELARRNARYGLVTLCIGGGMGIAAIFERAN